MLLVFDTHPVQYRVPIWRQMERESPGSIHVAYASDCSVRGYADAGFGCVLAWDDPMLEGYNSTLLKAENGVPLKGWNSLVGTDVHQIIASKQPTAVLLTGLNYRYDLEVYRAARKCRIPLWLRCETQDEAITRTRFKALVRGWVYRLIYRGIQRFFYIGELNRQHYLRHGVLEDRLTPARYCTVDRFAGMRDSEKENLRQEQRKSAGIPANAWVLGFSGKLIPKKHPDLLFELAALLPDQLRARTHLYFLGSGELDKELRGKADILKKQTGVSTFFPGFANQSLLASHYLAMDCLTFPSRRMGETWGLVANEAMQAGCSVAASDSVGCTADFKDWERFKVFKSEDAKAAATAVSALSVFPRSFSWARLQLQNQYSVEATAQALLTELGKLG